MKVAVCVKQIPDPSTPGRLDPTTLNLVRDGRLILDECDAYGVEMGLQLREAVGGGEVVLVSMAPSGETSGLRTALAMGADRAVLVSDVLLVGSDALGTAKVLARVMAREQPDLVLAATESTDGYTGTMPVQLAELLGLPSITFARRVEFGAGDTNRLVVQRQTEAGYDEVTCPLPALVTVTAGAVTPRYPTFQGIKSAKTKPIELVTIVDLGLDGSSVGHAGARQEVTAVAPSAPRSAGELVEDMGDAHETIVRFLEQLKIL